MDRRSKNQSTYCRTDNTSDGYLQTNQPVEHQSRALFLLSTFKRIFGHVYEGYLREDDPTGPKVEFTDGKIATYDFSDDLRHFQWGLQVGAGWRAFKHLNVYADLTWGLNDIFKNNFNTVTFAMYPIYLNIGFGYAF